MYSKPHFEYYQPVSKADGGLPDGLFSFEAFITRKACQRWLEQHNYNPADFIIKRYRDCDIELVAVIGNEGTKLPRIESIEPDRLYEMMLQSIRKHYGSHLDELYSNESLKHFIATMLVFQEIGRIEKSHKYNFASFGSSEHWYDKVLERLVDAILDDYTAIHPEINDPGAKKKYTVQLFYHTSLQFDVEAFNEKDAINVARAEADKLESLTFFEGLVEDGTPEVIERK